MTLAANFATGTAVVVDTGGKLTIGVNNIGGSNDAGGKLPPVSTTLVANNWNNIRLLTS
jgi:hypothetical protein